MPTIINKLMLDLVHNECSLHQKVNLYYETELGETRVNGEPLCLSLYDSNSSVYDILGTTRLIAARSTGDLENLRNLDRQFGSDLVNQGIIGTLAMVLCSATWLCIVLIPLPKCPVALDNTGSSI